MQFLTAKNWQKFTNNSIHFEGITMKLPRMYKQNSCVQQGNKIHELPCNSTRDNPPDWKRS